MVVSLILLTCRLLSVNTHHRTEHLVDFCWVGLTYPHNRIYKRTRATVNFDTGMAICFRKLPRLHVVELYNRSPSRRCRLQLQEGVKTECASDWGGLGRSGNHARGVRREYLDGIPVTLPLISRDRVRNGPACRMTEYPSHAAQLSGGLALR